MDNLTLRHATATSIESVSIIGLGYIGLPTAAMFASRGMQVAGVDLSVAVVEAVNAGRAHIEEGDLDVLVRDSVARGKLSASTTPGPADAFIIAVPTPVAHDAGHAPDISYVESAGRSIAPVLKRGDLVILESTSPVGTTQRLRDLLSQLRPDLSFPGNDADEHDVMMAYCPERIIPGRMLQELVENDRIIGGMTSRCASRAIELYRVFVRGECLVSDDKTAEMVKLTENAFRDVNIAFANELSMICADAGIDVWNVINFANRHPRVSILNPGAGVGGHCIAVDPWFIVASAPDRARLIRTSREVNDAKPMYILGRVAAALESRPGSRIVCLGLAYKPDVDDFRESPALEIALHLTELHPGQVVVADPFSAALPTSKDPRVGQLRVEPVEQALQDAGVVLMLVGHSAFKGLPRPVSAEVIDAVGFWR